MAQSDFWRGWELGTYQANAIGGLVGSIVLLILGFYWLAPLFLIASYLGFRFWEKRFDLAWRPYHRFDTADEAVAWLLDGYQVDGDD